MSFRGCEPGEVADLARGLGLPVVLILDELDLICRPTGWWSESARDVVHYGRHLKISILGSARRLANVHQDLISLADRIYLHRLTGPRDRAVIEANWGEEAGAVVASLPIPPAARLHYLTVPDDLEQDDVPDPGGDAAAIPEQDTPP